MKNLHRLVNPIRNKILNLIELKLKEGFTEEQLGGMCDFTKTQISTLRSGRRGANLTLNAALKIWEGMGYPPETLIADCNVEPLLAKKIKRIQASDYARVLNLFLEVFSNWEYANPQRLTKIEGYLEAVKDEIVELKSQPPVEHGASSSNYPAVDE